MDWGWYLKMGLGSGTLSGNQELGLEFQTRGYDRYWGWNFKLEARIGTGGWDLKLGAYTTTRCWDSGIRGKMKVKLIQ